MLISRGRKLRSPALSADGRHLLADVVTSVGVTIGILLVLEVVGGVFASFAQPARQSLMPGLVPPSDLPAAVALNSLTFNVARFIGPAIAAPIIAVFGVYMLIRAAEVL